MLALVHPLHAPDHRISVERSITNIATLSRPLSSSSGSARTTRTAQRKPQLLHSSSSAFPSSSSHSFTSRSSSNSSAVAHDSQKPRPNAVPPPQLPPSTSTASTSRPPPDSDSLAAHTPPSPHLQAVSSGVPAAFDIHTYPSSDLLRLLASLLTQIASTNDALSASDPTSHALSGLSSAAQLEEASRPPIWHTLTSASRSSLANPASALTFHARNIPTIALDAYLLRILRYCPTTNEVFLALLVYFDRMSRLASDATERTFVIDSYNVHRLVIAGVTVASKFFSDVFYTNSRYAKVGGLPQAELNQLELQFLLLNDFRLVISTEEMQRYAEQLILFSQSQSPSSSTPSTASSNTTANSHSPVLSPSQSHAPSSTSSSGPTQAMGAIDAFGGRIAPDRTPSMRSAHPHTDNARWQGERDDDADASSILSETETEGGDTTDDEPTIRPPNSTCSSSSNYGDAGDEEGEGEFKADDEPEGERQARDRGDATPELRARRLVREISEEDVGMSSP
ncbi:cyclin-domain-containing protein [Leucogyrophana mollusca]|uniref:Cyclin-domain-containing protein n=1 Tax=Leucogyrophana mollusca TaxID=85980 RepID=A0ACB8BYA8_9AGAM|nr:cyclin-domain-containing protein [Leucogyrophana mollusca]